MKRLLFFEGIIIYIRLNLETGFKRPKKHQKYFKNVPKPPL